MSRLKQLKLFADVRVTLGNIIPLCRNLIAYSDL